MTKAMLTKIAAVATLLWSMPASACPYDFADDYLADPNGVADSTPAWNQAMADEVPCLTILGTFRFYSPPDDILHAPAIVGLSLTSSQLVRSYDGGSFIRVRGLSGGRIAHIAIVADTGTTGGLGLSLEAGPLGQASAWTFEGLSIQGWGSPFGTFSWPLHIWGDGGPLPGWRDGTIRNVTIFGHESGAMYCRSCNSVKITGLATHGTSPKVWFSNPTHITIAASDIQGPIQVNAGYVLMSLLGSWSYY